MFLRFYHTVQFLTTPILQIFQEQMHSFPSARWFESTHAVVYVPIDQLRGQTLVLHHGQLHIEVKLIRRASILGRKWSRVLELLKGIDPFFKWIVGAHLEGVAFELCVEVCMQGSSHPF